MARIVVLLALCVSAALAESVQYQYRYGSQLPYGKSNQQYVERQQIVLKLFKYVNQPQYYNDYVQLAQSYKIENELSNYHNSTYVKHVVNYYHDNVLPQDEIFSPFNEEHLKQAIALYKVLYYAKTFDVFHKTAVWARYYLNQGLYLYSLSVAVLHRADTYGIEIPAIYDVYPYYFHDAHVLAKVQAYQQHHLLKPVGPPVYSFVANYSSYYNKDSEQSHLAYYFQDVGINAFYYYYNLYHPSWLNQEHGFVNYYQRGEEFYYFYQQFLARYHLERISHGYHDGPVYNYERILQEPYYSYQSYANGVPFPSRPYNAPVNVESQENFYWSNYYDEVQKVDERLGYAVDWKYIYSANETKYDICQPSVGFNILCNEFESNTDAVNPRFFGDIQNLARVFLGYSFRGYSYVPSALEQYETSARDPAFYHLYKRILSYLVRYKYYSPKYTYSDLEFTGVQVSGIEVNDLVTYFENYYTDAAYGVYYGKEDDDLAIRVIQSRLNHKPFVYKINVESEAAVDSVVRVFIGPKNDQNINFNRLYYVELDRFLYKLKSGSNVIERNSYQIYSGDYYGIKDLEHRIKAALANGEYYNIYGSEVLYGYPNRYALPRGNYGGQEYQFYVIVSPYKPYTYSEEFVQRRQHFKEGQEVPHSEGEFQDYYHPHVGLGVQKIDSYNLGYPFDKHIDEEVFYVPNSYSKVVKIFHKSEAEINASA